jgi:hypothetical protein
MSSFKITARHKKNGAIYDVWCLDDYFGRRQYGYLIGGLKGVAMREEDFHREYTPEPPPREPEGA